MNLLCPACHTPLPADANAVVTCLTCAAEVDVTRAGTISGRPRFVPELDRTGTDVGGFRIQARLGGGGMGTVYRAGAPDGAAVAIKFLAPALADNPDVVARFAREIETLARLQHPAIVHVLAHGTDGGTPWFAMALVEGSDLRARIAAGALPPAETAAVFGRLFAALAHAHDRGVVHRDLKPANVLLGDGGARLADFGIARLEAEMLTGPMVTRLTETAAVLGTLPYMSPEQRRGGAVDRRSDLFSAGVMLYEATTGALPQGAFQPPSELNPAYGRAFDRLVMQLLQADPNRRPAAAAQVTAALAAALAPRRSRPRALAAAGGLALLLIGGGLGARMMFRDGAGKDGGKPSFASAAPEAAKPAAPPERQAPPEKQALPEPPPLDKQAPPEKNAAVDTAALAESQTKALLGDGDGKKPRLGKIKRRVVLKAVSDVKKLRATSAPTKKEGPPPIDEQEFEDLKQAGKIDKLIKAGKPVPQVIRGGKKKASKVVPLDAELDPGGAAATPDAGTGGEPLQPTRN